MLIDFVDGDTNGVQRHSVYLMRDHLRWPSLLLPEILFECDYQPHDGLARSRPPSVGPHLNRNR